MPAQTIGRPLDHATNAIASVAFGHDFSAVRVHDDAAAAESAHALGARAYTLGRDIVFERGEHAPGSTVGQRLLLHELAHVVQQQPAARSAPASGPQDAPLGRSNGSHERAADEVADAILHGRPAPALPALSAPMVQCQFGDVHLAELKREVLARVRINYRRAREQNGAYAGLRSLGWGAKLRTAAGGAYAALGELWEQGAHDRFADAVASRQFDLGVPEAQIDGIIGPGTWARMAGLGEAMANIDSVSSKYTQDLCYKASEERIKRGFRMASGRSFELPEDRSASVFNVIIASMVGRMRDVDEAYRGTGAAGALVYAGLGTFVPEGDVFTGGLRPGAAIQVWRDRGAYELLRVGEVVEKGKRRRITETDADFYGTSFVFVRYDTATNERILVRHHSSEEWHTRADFAVWIAANAALRP